MKFISKFYQEIQDVDYTGNGLRLTLTLSNTWAFNKINVLRLSSKYVWRMAVPFKSTVIQCLHLETNLTKYSGKLLGNCTVALINLHC